MDVVPSVGFTVVVVGRAVVVGPSVVVVVGPGVVVVVGPAEEGHNFTSSSHLSHR